MRYRNRFHVWAAILWMGFAAGCLSLAQDKSAESNGKPHPEPGAPVAAPEVEAAPPAVQEQRIQLNLLGAANTAAGESRRNENVQFNLVDNNALKELNLRLGVTATILTEFQPARGYFGAEYGNPPRQGIHTTVPPVSSWHGRVFYSHLNSAFSARSFFQVGDVKPAREHDYGFATNFLVREGTSLSLEGAQQRLRGNVNGNVLVPSLEERTPLTNDPQVGAVVASFLNAYPAELPNRTDINARALNTNAPQVIDNNRAAIRLLQQAGSRDSFNLLYQFTSQSVDAFQLVKGQNPDTETKSHRARATWNRAWSPATITELSSGFDRIGSLLIPEPNAVGPMISTSGLTTLGPLGGIPIDRAENLFQQAAQLRHTAGRHQWSAGFEVTRRQFNGVMTDVHRGFFSFAPDFGTTAFNNLRLGRPSQHLVSIGDPHRGYRNTEELFYLGDTWRARNNLTVSAALRWEPVGRPTEVNGLEEIAYDADRNNVGGHLGLAWRLPGEGGVIRASYGAFFGQIYPVTYQQVRLSPPNNYKIVIPAADLLDPLQGVDLNDLSSFVPTTYGMDPELATPYTHLYNFAWERAIGSRLNIQLGYVGSRAHKLLIMWYLNRARPVPGVPQTTATWNIRRPNPSLAEIRTVLNGSRGFYDAARATLNVREWRGLSVDASYWWSKSIDLGSSYTNTAFEGDSRVSRSQNEFNSQDEMRGLSDFDQPHALLSRVSYAVPALTGGEWWRQLARDWTLSSVVLFKSGTPFTVFSGSDAPGFGNVDANGGDRPNLVDPSILGRTVGDPDTSASLLPRSAFSLMAPTDPGGNLGRSTFRKGAIRNVNASLARRWVFRSERSLLLRAESINLFNTPQFAEPGFELSNPNFGTITNTLNDGRTFRLRLELGW